MERYYSSCCGTQVHHDAVDYQRCPSCKESCDVVKESDEEQAPVEYAIIEMELFKWECLRQEFRLVNGVDFKLKEIKVKDDLFKDDEMDKSLGRLIHKAIEKRDEYRFKKRNNIK